ncbi:MAG: class I SAM-dependent methyltransferase [Candidatus Hermodarchaeota archaeon]
MKLPEVEKVLTSKEAYDFVATLGFPAIHPGGSEATKELISLCQLDETTKVLDVGCGAGQTACTIAELYGSQVTGIDISKSMLIKAEERIHKKKLENKVDFQLADVYQLPFEDGTFDVVIFESLLAPLSEEVLALKEMFKVIRPGGRIGANEGILDPSTPPEVFEMLAKHPSFSGVVITFQVLKSMFEDVGFNVTHFTEFPFSMSILKEMGVRGIISFMLKTYPGLLIKLMKDSRFRKYQRFDEKLNKTIKEYASYVLVVAQKPK